MQKKFYYEHILGLLLTAVLACLGLAFMSARDYQIAADEAVAAQEEANEQLIAEYEAELEDLVFEVPVSGMNVIMNEYAAFSEENAASYLSTTILAGTTDDDEYVNEDGTSIGKYIVCTASSSADVYEEPWEDEADAQLLGTIETYGIVTLISQEGEWCHILSGTMYGYVKTEDFAFGEDAKALDENTYFDVAVITEDDTYMYQLANTSSTVLCVLSSGLQAEIVSEGSNYIKIYIEGVGEGYVKTSLIEQETIRRYVQLPEESEAEALAIEEGIAAAQEIGPCFIWPLPYPYYTITSDFGPRSVSVGTSYHRGIDIKADKGTSIYAVMDGVVEQSSYSSSQGYYVILYHGSGLYTMYCHMCQASELTAGESVSQGDVIGYVGSTGNSSGYHLHFAVGVGGYDKYDWVDPELYLY